MMMSPGGGTTNRWIDFLFFWLRLLWSFLAFFFFLMSFLVSLSVFFLASVPPLGTSAYGCGFIFFLCYFRRYAYFSASSHGVVQVFMVTVLPLHRDLRGSVGWVVIQCN